MLLLDCGEMLLINKTNETGRIEGGNKGLVTVIWSCQCTSSGHRVKKSLSGGSGHDVQNKHGATHHPWLIPTPHPFL